MAGLVAAGAGLAVAELTSAASDPPAVPGPDVGDRVIDGVPNSIKTLAIDWFGTNDKLALLTGIGVVLGLYAAALGVVALTRFWRLAIAGAAAFGLIGAYASQSSRRPAPWWAVAPSIAGGLVAAIALLAQARAARARLACVARPRHTDSSRCRRGARGPIDRRPSLAGDRRNRGRRVGDRHDRACTGDPIRRRRPTPRCGCRAAACPAAGPSRGRRRRRHSPFVTPNADFYRIDPSFTVPASIESWALAVTGMVTRPLTLVRRSGRARSSRPTSRSRASRTRWAAS